MNKKVIVFDVGSLNGWIGGVYYVKNIIFCLLQSEKIRCKYSILLFLDKKYEDVFDVFGDTIERHLYKSDTKKGRFAEFKRETSNIACQYIYNYQLSQYGIYKKKQAIFWIADFQHKHYPNFFKKSELLVRDTKYWILSKHSNTLILSSEDAKNDFQRYFRSYRVDVQVVPFVSYIEEEIKAIDEKFEQEVLCRYKLETFKYVYIPNQFWQHKNHIVVLRAIQRIVSNNLQKGYKFVFTGELKDYRNPQYYNAIKEIMDNPKIKDYVVSLGFVDRKEQLTIMKNAKVIVQPSLFEGWGTVLEDAKVLDKKVILSDIPVHREQMNKNCTLFNPRDDKQLTEKIISHMEMNYCDDVDKGIENMYCDARFYASRLEKILL